MRAAEDWRCNCLDYALVLRFVFTSCGVSQQRGRTGIVCPRWAQPPLSWAFLLGCVPCLPRAQPAVAASLSFRRQVRLTNHILQEELMNPWLGGFAALEIGRAYNYIAIR